MTVYFLTLQKAVVSASPAALCNLLAIILKYCNPSNPLELWFNHKTELSEDFIHRFGTSDDRSDNASLAALEHLVLRMEGRPLRGYCLPAPDQNWLKGLPAHDSLRLIFYHVLALSKYRVCSHNFHTRDDNFLRAGNVLRWIHKFISRGTEEDIISAGQSSVLLLDR
ncbi:hypothetical protein RRG08_025442 [Elysia crispata]|uniref:Uncharacterized protein n=1 Tax=Elysia crispata TaxID=231223 RepID=A0AAE1DCH7_9GAST|nr:hypothetical protein RRG08_025442 [Elysia crispata]